MEGHWQYCVLLPLLAVVVLSTSYNLYQNKVAEERLQNLENMSKMIEGIRASRLSQQPNGENNLWKSDDKTTFTARFSQDVASRSLEDILVGNSADDDGERPPHARVKRSLEEQEAETRHDKETGLLARKRVRHRQSSSRDSKLMAKAGKHCAKKARKVAKEAMKNRTVAMVHFSAHLNPIIKRVSESSNGRPVAVESGLLEKGTLKPLTNQSYRFWVTRNDINADVFNFDPSQGVVTVNKNGTYLVYAQVLSYKGGPRTAFGIRANDKLVSKCLSSSSQHVAAGESGDSAADGVEEYHMCSTTLAVALLEGERVFVQPLYVTQNLIIDPTATLWGMIRLGG